MQLLDSCLIIIVFIQYSSRSLGMVFELMIPLMIFFRNLCFNNQNMLRSLFGPTLTLRNMDQTICWFQSPHIQSY